MSRRVFRPAPVERPVRPKPEQLPLPTAAQLDLLKAALLTAECAAPAWRRWKERGLQLVTVEGDSTRMFSQLWANREAAGIDSEDFPLLRGVYRQGLANNALKLAHALDATRCLTEAGIPVIFLKSAAMIVIANRLGWRRIGDVDVLIPEADAVRAVTLLRAAGLSPKPGYEAGPLIGVRHAWPCVGPDGLELDLHRWPNKVPGDDRIMFETAREAHLLGRSVLIPSATEALISAVTNGFASRAPAAPLRWIADAMLILETDGDSIEWDTLALRARRPGLTLGLATGLDFLAREFGAAVPSAVLAELHRLPVNWRERGAHWSKVRAPLVGGNLLLHLERHRVLRLYDPNVVPWDFLGYLAQTTGTFSGKRVDVLKRHSERLARRLVERTSDF